MKKDHCVTCVSLAMCRPSSCGRHLSLWFSLLFAFVMGLFRRRGAAVIIYRIKGENYLDCVVVVVL